MSRWAEQLSLQEMCHGEGQGILYSELGSDEADKRDRDKYGGLGCRAYSYILQNEGG